jgi:hypothetical protein
MYVIKKYDTSFYTLLKIRKIWKEKLLTYLGLSFYTVWCNTKGVADREILETYFNATSKSTP